LTLKQSLFSNIHTIGNAAGADVVINVTGETTRPTVSSANVTNARGGQSFTTTFSEPVDVATISPLQVIDTSAGNAVVAGTWSTTGNNAVFTASSLWRTGHTYSVTFPTTVADLAGNTLQTATTRTLVTETTAPTAPLSATTSNGALVLTFDEALDPASVRATTFGAIAAAGTIRVTTVAGADVAACVHAEGRVVTIDHLDAAAGTALKLVVTTGVTDEAGNAIASNSTIDATRP
jgi:Tol biopolymer transport system component